MFEINVRMMHICRLPYFSVEHHFIVHSRSKVNFKLTFVICRRLKVGDFDYSAACSTVAKITEGMSGREITNLALDWQMTTYASLEGVFTEEIMLNRAKAAVEHKKHKVSGLLIFVVFFLVIEVVVEVPAM